MMGFFNKNDNDVKMFHTPSIWGTSPRKQKCRFDNEYKQRFCDDFHLINPTIGVKRMVNVHTCHEHYTFGDFTVPQDIQVVFIINRNTP